jgi:hypothetical protein
MPDDQAFPPPGSQPEAPPAPLPPYPSPPPGAPIPSAPGWPPASAPPPPGMLGAAHKPGAMPLRPLGLGDIYDAAFRIIRFNPKATVGSAVLVAAVTMMIPVVVTAIATFTVGMTLSEDGFTASAGASEILGTIVSIGSLYGGTILLQIGLIFVTGMVAHVANAAAIGQRLTLGEAWAATKGKRWKLLGLTAVINVAFFLALGVYIGLWVAIGFSGTAAAMVVWGIVTVPAFIAGMWWFWIRIYYMPAPVLMLEPVGVFAAIGRGYRLTHKQFWRIFGIGLLTVIITSVAGGILSVPVSLVGQLASLAVPEYEVLGLAVTQAVASILSAAFVAPFTAAVTALLYIDQRMRKEAFDVELMSRAGITSS